MSTISLVSAIGNGSLAMAMVMALAWIVILRQTKHSFSCVHFFDFFGICTYTELYQAA